MNRDFVLFTRLMAARPACATYGNSFLTNCFTVRNAFSELISEFPSNVDAADDSHRIYG
jgi:hypothetical protein